MMGHGSWLGAAVLAAVMALGAGSAAAQPPTPGVETLLAGEAGEVTHLGGGVTARRAPHARSPHRFELTRPQAETVETSLDPDRPLAPQVARAMGLWSLPVTATVDYQRLIAKGTLRRATREEVRRWRDEARYRAAGGAAVPDASAVPLPNRGGQHPFWTLTRPVAPGALLVNARERYRLFVPADLPQDGVPQGASGTHRLADGSCFGLGYGCTMPAEATAPAGPECFGDALPVENEVHGLGARMPSPARMLNGHGFEGAPRSRVGQIDVHVGRTAKPVLLALGAEERAVWVLDLAPGSRLAGVLVRGSRSQAVAGVPEGVPVRFSTADGGASPGCGAGPAGQAYGTEVEAWAKDLQAIAGRSFDRWSGQRAPTHFRVGAGTGAGATPRADFFGEPVWGPAGETPRLDPGSVEAMHASRPLRKAPLGQGNPLLAVLLGAFAAIGVSLTRERLEG